MKDITPTGELGLTVEATPAVLSFNVEDLKSQALAIAEKYRGLVFTEEEIPSVRKDMTMLNEMAQRLDRARIDTVKLVTAPVKAFEADIKEVASILLQVREEMGAKVNEYVKQQRENKRLNVLRLIEEVRAGFEHCVDLQVDMRETWLAKSTSMISVKDDVREIFTAHTKAVEAAAALVVAKQERTQAVQAKNDALQAQYGFTVSSLRFAKFMDLAWPLAEAYSMMEKEYEKENEVFLAAKQAKEEEAARKAQEDAERAERARVAEEQRQERERVAAEQRAEKERLAEEQRAQQEAERKAQAEERAQRRVQTAPDQPAFEAAAPEEKSKAPVKADHPQDDAQSPMTAMEALVALVQEIRESNPRDFMGNKTVETDAYKNAVAVIAMEG